MVREWQQNRQSFTIRFRKQSTYMSGIDFEISGQRRCTSSFRRCKAKLLKAGSGSERKPTRPAAEVKPTIVARKL